MHAANQKARFLLGKNQFEFVVLLQASNELARIVIKFISLLQAPHFKKIICLAVIFNICGTLIACDL